MKRKGKIKFFVVLILLIAFIYAAFFGVSIDNYFGDKNTLHFGIRGAKDIRWGTDISGGVEAVFSPDIEKDKITEENMDSAKEIIETRLVNNNITDYEVFIDYNERQVVVRFPQQSTADGEKFDAQEVVNELGETAQLKFCKNTDTSDVILTGNDISHAEPGYTDESGYVVSLTLKSSGVSKFSAATKELAGNGTISIWMDDTQISNPSVNSQITSTSCQIEGMADSAEATDLANKINAGALPFALTTDNSMLQIISPTLGSEALQVMVIAAGIAFGIICLIMIFKYRLCGVIACITLAGQAAGMIACVSGFFDFFNSFTLTVPGIAGMILSIGMGVDANVITAERIKEEFQNGRTLDGAMAKGFHNSLSSIIDGNLTNVIAAVVLMGAFGTTEGFCYKIFSWIFRFFSSSITGSIYSFGYTLLAGVIVNFVMGVLVTRILLQGISQFKFFKKPWLYGGAKSEKA